MANDLKDNPALSRYEFELDGAVAIAVYRREPGRLIVTHTEVPAALRGRGVGSQLVRRVLEDIRARGLKVVPRCPFVAAFIAANPAFKDLLG